MKLIFPTIPNMMVIRQYKMTKVWTKIIFLLSSITLAISLKLFWNLGLYVDAYNTSPSVVLGGDFWLHMTWLRLLLLAVVVVLSALKLFNEQN